MTLLVRLNCAVCFALLGCAAPTTSDAKSSAGQPSTSNQGGNGAAGRGASGTSTGGLQASAGSGGSVAGGTGNTAGTGSTSSTGGNGGGAPHTVEPCPTNQVGVWEDVTPGPIVGLLYAGGAVVVDPKNTATVYVGSGFGGGLFKSTDCGANWTHVNTGQGAAQMDLGRLWDIVIDPVDPKVLYSVNGYGALGLWKTTDGGVDWAQLFPPESAVAKTANSNFASIVSMDPGDHLHLVVAFHDGCSGAYAPSCQAETKDGGQTWRLFKVPGGGEGSGPIVINSTTWIFGVFGALMRTSDSGATWASVRNQGAHYQMYTAANGKYYVGSPGGVITSSGDGVTWTLIPNSGGDLEGIAGDGKSIYVSQQFSPGKYFKASEADPTHWTEIPKPPKDISGLGWGGYFMAGDPDHHIIYSSEMGAGVWRMVTY